MQAADYELLELLRARRLLTEDQLEACLQELSVLEARGRPRSLASVLERKGLLSPEQLRGLRSGVELEGRAASPASPAPRVSERGRVIGAAVAALAVALLLFALRGPAEPRLPPPSLASRTAELQLGGAAGERSTSELELVLEAARKAIVARRFAEARAELDGMLDRSGLPPEARERLLELKQRGLGIERRSKDFDDFKDVTRRLIRERRLDEAERGVARWRADGRGLAPGSEAAELEGLSRLIRASRKLAASVERAHAKRSGRRQARESPVRREAATRAAFDGLKLSEPRPVEPARAARFKSELWDKRLKRAGRWLEGERERRVARLEAEATRAKRQSRRRSLTVKLGAGLTFGSMVITRYDPQGFELKGPRGSLGYRWDLADPGLALKVRQLGLDEGDADSNFRFGQFCIQRRFFKEARRAFKAAVKLRPSLAERLPSFSSLERASEVFGGDFTRLGGGLVRFDYGFSKLAELRDFLSSGFRPAMRGGSAVVASRRDGTINMMRLRGVDFTGFLRARLTLGRSSEALAVLAIEVPETGGLRVSYAPAAGRVVIEDLAARAAFEPRVFEAPKMARRISALAKGRSIEVKLDGRRVARYGFPGAMDKLRLSFGGSGRGGLAIDALRIDGRVTQTWLRKTFQGSDDALRGILADAGLGAPESSWRRAEEELSAEDSLGRSGAVRGLSELVARARALITKSTSRAGREAFSLLSRGLQEDPTNPVLCFERARVARSFGLWSVALSDLNMAIAQIGGFYEALALRAQLLLALDRDAEAERDIARSRALRSESAGLFVAQSRLLFERGEIKAAHALLEVGFSLWPRRRDIGRPLGNYGHVLRGPPWERRFVVETPHYRVMSDISQERTRDYAERLEWIFAYYSEVFGARPPSGRATVLIFETREGYNQYANLTSNSRVESTLGYYHPGYDQLLLFEDKDQGAENSETLDTLYHEGFHQFISAVVPTMPRWLNEGLAEYFGATRFDRSGRPQTVGALQNFRLEPLQRYLAEGGQPRSFRVLMNEPPERFMSGNPGLNYAQSWGMVHFFLHGRLGRRELFRRYFEALRRGATTEQAFEQSYGSLNLRGLERGFVDYVRGLKSRRR